jgi:hypothetical protein
MAQGKDEGMDILKFFIAVMSLLTVFVAGFAGYNWSKAAALAEQVEQDEQNLKDIEALAGKQDFKMQVARAKIAREQIDIRTADLQRYLTDSATKMGFSLKTNEPVGGAAGVSQQGYVKKSYKIVIERQTLEVIGDYLFWIQASWPGLKIEELNVREVPVKKGEPFAGWQATVLVSTFRPKE